MPRSVISTRPLPITLIVILLTFGGVTGIIVNAFYLMEFTAIPLYSVSYLAYLLEIAISLAYLVIAFGLFHMEPYARRWGVAVLLAGFLFKLVTLSLGILHGKPVIEIVYNIHIVLYLVAAMFLRTAKTRSLFTVRIVPRE